MRKISMGLIAVVLLASLILSGCAQSVPAPTSPSTAPSAAQPAAKPVSLPKSIEFSCYPVGTSGYNVTNGYAKIVSGHTPIAVNVRPMSGATEQLPIINRGEIDIGMAVSPDTDRAWKGTGEFTTKHSNLRLLNYIYTNQPANIVVRRDSSYKKIADLKGKRLTSGFGSTINCQLQLEVSLASAGMTFNDVVPVPVPDMPAGLNALREGRVDASFGIAPTVPITVELDSAIGLRILPLEPGPAFEKALADKLPGCKPATIKAGFGIAKEDVLTHDLPFLYYSSVATSPEAIYQVVKALYEFNTEIQSFDVIVKNFAPKMMYDRPAVVPFHDGAIRLYKEKGVWTKEMEDWNNKLLGK